MNESCRTCAITLALLTLLAASAQAQPAPTLKVGDDAPPLVVQTWINGGPVDKLEKGKVYILEFWATWCGPCISAMPHVTRLQKKYADQGVVFIGMNVWERDPARVEPFVIGMKDKLGYAVATDVVPPGQREGVMAKAWMRAAGLNHIPTTFIIDRQGRIAWIGHPRRMERPLRLILANQFDPAAEALAQPAQETQRLADEDAIAALLSDRGQEAALNKAIATIDRLIALDEGSLTTPAMDGGEPYGILKLKTLMLKEDYAAASALAARLAEVLPEDGGELRPVLHVLAWAPDFKKLDTDLMLRLARQSADAAPKDDWKPQRMLARVHAARGEYDQAIESQRRALAGAPARDKPWEEARLKIYLLDKADAEAPK